MSDDPAMKRAVLREHGITVPDRGRLSAEHEAAYERLSQQRQPTLEDCDGGVTSADFEDDDAAEYFDQREAEAEQTPRAGKGQRGQRKQEATARGRGLWNRARKAAGGGGGQKKKHKWVGTADVIEHFWSQLAWSTRPIPPLQKILAAQAPTAGVLLQDALRDTIIDRAVLQPAARLEDRLQAVNAMAGPPIWTMMIASFGGAVTDEAGRPVTDVNGDYVFDNRTAVMVGGLRFSLMSWLKIAQKSADDIQESAEELNKLGDEADKLIRWILAPPEPGQSPKDTEREARKMAMDFIGGHPPDEKSRTQPEPGQSGAPAARFASSAFSPAASAGPSGGVS